MYGRTPQRSRDYGRMVNQKHFDRVLALIDDDKAVIGGTAEPTARTATSRRRSSTAWTGTIP